MLALQRAAAPLASRSTVGALRQLPAKRSGGVLARGFQDRGQLDDSYGGSKLEAREDDSGATAGDTFSLGGAIATLVFGASLMSERLNGIGLVQNLELHNRGADPLLLAAIAGLLAATVWPDKRQEPNLSFVGMLQNGVGRLAYFGLAGAIGAEMWTGRGILCLLDFETGVEALSDVEAIVAFLLMILLTGPQSTLRKSK
jgi:hypothetical protein